MGGHWLRKLSVLVGATILGVTGASVGVQAGPTALNWGPVSTTQAPPGREFAAMTFDSTRSRTVLFGGGSPAFTNYSDTWEFDGVNWVQRIPSTSPPGLVASAMAFDANRGVSVLFGGQTATGDISDTWEWNGTNWTLRAFAMSPSPRIWTTMAYDTTRGRLVLFGGEGPGSTDLGDTWEYDGSSWIRMTPAGSPSPRWGAAMAYDPGLGRVVLFGGVSAGGRQADTWEWDGTSWTVVNPSSSPFSRMWHSMAFDPEVGHTVMFGGDHIEPFGLGPINDTWEWDGSQWTQDWTSAAPSVRAGQTMALDANGRILTFGGSDEGRPGVFPTDTQELSAGIATPPGNPAVTFTPASADFGQVIVGSTSSSADLYVQSSGTGPLLTTMSTTGDFAVSSTYCPVAPNPLAAGANCFAFVTFTPTAVGDRFGDLVLTGNVPGGSVSVPLHGIGVAIPDFSIAASPTSLSVVQGSSATSAASTEAIGAVGAIDLSATVSPTGPTAALSPATVVAGGVSTLTVSAPFGTLPGRYTVTVTGIEGSISHSTNVVVTVTLKGIVNGGFENGDLTGWTATGVASVVPHPRSGVFAGQVGSSSASATSTLAQTFTVPASGGKLTFWYLMSCPDKVKNDWFVVTLHDGVTGTTSTLQPQVCSKMGGWTKVTANLSSHAGNYVTLTFLNHDDGRPSDPTFTLVDDVALS